MSGGKGRGVGIFPHLGQREMTDNREARPSLATRLSTTGPAPRGYQPREGHRPDGDWTRRDG